MKLRKVCVAGTFDRLHRGHEAVLAAAFAAGERVVIALTTDEYVKKFKELKGKGKIKSFKERKQDLERWLKQRNLEKRTEFVPLDDPIGPAPTADFDGLVVTSQNRPNGEKINHLRIARGQRPIKLLDSMNFRATNNEGVSRTL